MYDQAMCFSICYCLPRRIIHRRINAILERLYYLSQEMVCHLSAKTSLRQIYLFIYLLNVQWMAACHGASTYSVPSCQQGDGHWGSSHEGSGRHPRQHGAGRGRRFGKFTLNSHRVCSLLWPSFCELIVNVMGNIAAEARDAVIRYLAAIPA